jgi:hypothetical protein
MNDHLAEASSHAAAARTTALVIAGREMEACVERWFAQLEADGLIAKTPTERVQELRQRREALGLTRLELYAHPEDHEAIKALAEKLQRKRLKEKKR